MKLNAKEQAANAIKWIDNLRYYKKTIYQLGKYDYIDNTTKYCCLGVACRVMDLDFELSNSYDNRLTNLLGFVKDRAQFKSRNRVVNETLVEGLMSANDSLFPKDEGFKNMTKFIKENFDEIFKPKVAKILKKHYAK